MLCASNTTEWSLVVTTHHSPGLRMTKCKYSDILTTLYSLYSFLESFWGSFERDQHYYHLPLALEWVHNIEPSPLSPSPLCWSDWENLSLMQTKTVLFRSGESSPGQTRTGTGSCLRRNGSESSTQPAARPPCESRPVLSTVFPSHHCLLIIWPEGAGSAGNCQNFLS